MSTVYEISWAEEQKLQLAVFAILILCLILALQGNMQELCSCWLQQIES